MVDISTMSMIVVGSPTATLSNLQIQKQTIAGTSRCECQQARNKEGTEEARPSLQSQSATGSSTFIITFGNNNATDNVMEDNMDTQPGLTQYLVRNLLVSGRADDLMATGEPAFGHLIRLFDNTWSNEVQIQALSAIRKMVSAGIRPSEEQMHTLVLGFRFVDRQVEAAVQECVSEIGRPVVPCLLKGMVHENMCVRNGSARAINMMSETIDLPEAIPLLLRSIKYELRKDERKAAVKMLGNIGKRVQVSGEAIDELVGGLRNFSPSMLLFLGGGLGPDDIFRDALVEIGEPALPHVMKLLDEPDALIKGVGYLAAWEILSGAGIRFQQGCLQNWQHRE